MQAHMVRPAVVRRRLVPEHGAEQRAEQQQHASCLLCQPCRAKHNPPMDQVCLLMGRPPGWHKNAAR
eukprot:1158015-Pelagomonas_calceolata.AAC.9